jgi:hypothetical protein
LCPQNFVSPEFRCPFAGAICVGVPTLLITGGIINSAAITQNNSNSIIDDFPEITFPDNFPVTPSEDELVCTVGDPENFLPKENPQPPSEDCWGTTQFILAGCSKLEVGKAAACRVAAWALFAICVSSGGFGGPSGPNPNF